MSLHGNLDYFFRELITSYKNNFSTHLITIVSITFAFTILGFITVAWWTGENLGTYIENQGEIMIFYDEKYPQRSVYISKKTKISQLEGVKDIININKEKSYSTNVRYFRSRLRDSYVL